MGADRRVPPLLQWALVGAVVALVAACAGVPQGRPQQVRFGYPESAPALFEDYGCVACHSIPGVPGADAMVGPPLTSFGRRSFIAGVLNNDEENLARWIMNPTEIQPGTAMPDLGVSEGDALSMAAYLLSLD